jgi:predicted TIM-barrel enzyme
MCQMRFAGVDNNIIHFGNSSGGTIGSKTVLGEEKSLARAAAIFDALAPKHADLIYTCHGGAIEYPPQFEAFLAKESRFDGYVGGSSAERFPIEDSVPKTAQAFKAIRKSV